MKKFTLLFIIPALLLMTSCKHKLSYPVTKKVDTVDNYFGTKVADPYRWLENDTSKETAEWVKAQNAVTENYLAKIPFREKIRETLKKRWNYPKYGIPFREGPWYFYFKNDGLQNQSVLYVRKGIEGTPKVLLDPNTLSPDGTIALGGISASHDGKYLAYSVARSGSDWNEVIILEIESGKQLPDTLKWVKFSGMSWQKDGFYYSRFEEPKPGEELTAQNKNHKVYYHVAGTPQKSDRLVYENPKFPERNYGAQVTEDERFLILYESESTTGNALYYQDLTTKQAGFKPLVTGFENDYTVIDNAGGKLIVMTNCKAPKKKLILMDPELPDPANWKTIIPERDDVLESADLAGDRIISTYMQKALSKAFVYDLKGKFLHEMVLPGLGTLTGISGKSGQNIAFYGYTGFRYPTTIFKYDVKENKSSVYNAPEIQFTPDDYETTQVYFSSKDKTTVSMFLVYKKGLKLDGNNPTLLYGYGGFNVSLTPNFSIGRTIFLENGGVYAVANIRGGGEYGEEWHKGGIKEKKQNVFDDFIAAAEYLISEKYTNPQKLAIMGGSNGGLLMGACMTQRPELFKVVVSQVGVMDMLRYHKFTIGRAWASDYGTSDTKEGFEYLYKYSPLHNLKKGVKYPATLALTGDHDDRVVPMHTFKFIATLQEDQEGCNPVIVRIETKAGHGGGKPTTKVIEESADTWSFVMYNLGMEVK
ncbi:MAG: prolyl oligopeptidase family serine peptidase [Bacteroidetes bacterium]|nr:prolyl oligopeptidase family serine peptidase [Bacteroidota bacterium]